MASLSLSAFHRDPGRASAFHLCLDRDFALTSLPSILNYDFTGLPALQTWAIVLIHLRLLANSLLLCYVIYHSRLDRLYANRATPISDLSFHGWNGIVLAGQRTDLKSALTSSPKGL